MLIFLHKPNVIQRKANEKPVMIIAELFTIDSFESDLFADQKIIKIYFCLVM